MPAFSVIQEVKAVDERTVTITIAQRDLEFISYLTSAIIPKGYDDQATHPVGTGPFMYVSRSPQENFVIQRFDDYWGTPAYLDKVTYKIYESADALVTALKRQVHRPVRPSDLVSDGAAGQRLPDSGGYHESGTGGVSEQRRGPL